MTHRGSIHLSELNVQMTAAERIYDFIDLAEQESKAGLLPPASWPSQHARIEVENLSMRYRPELPLVLKEVSFVIEPRERVGIVGRTGSGKSSLVQSFFRFLEAETGRIVIDGLDISTLNIDALRSKLTIIPQDATLFEASLRFNLDPFEQASDVELWRALQAVDLAGKETSRVKSLDMDVMEGGSNFSAGEKQLIALARGLIKLQSSALVILDEASASLDHDTDMIIQKTIRKEITGSLLCIAHRLNTVADFDRILCLDQGRLVAFDTPINVGFDQACLQCKLTCICQLLNDHNSPFRFLAKESGEFDKLYAIAQASHMAKQAGL
jgi:ABC-type multidrug transport system fused ATPase/permease subunit